MGTVLGVIESISAGYRLLGRRIELLLAPILLDLLLWLGPQLSVAPLFERVAKFYTEASSMDGMPAEMADMSRQVADQVALLGDNSNLLSGLVNSSLMGVPSLIATITSLGHGTIHEIDNPFVAVLLFSGFGILGLLIGVVYLNLMARILPIGNHPRPLNAAEFGKLVLRHWGMAMLYIVFLFVLLIAASVPVALATALLSFVSPALGSLFVVILSGAVLVLLFYLYFVIAAIIVDNLPVHRAIAQSFVIVRNNFWSTLGFVVIFKVITLGIALLIAEVATISQLGMISAILINAYIGSGLAMAYMVFYRSRMVKQEELERLNGAP